MKKLLAMTIALAMLLTAAALAEVAEPTPVPYDYTGTWYLTELVMDGVTLSPATFGMEMRIELNADGTALIASEGDDAEDDASGEGLWLPGEAGVTITMGDSVMGLTLREDTLVDEEDGLTMVFGRQPALPDDYQPAAPVAASQADFEGDWTALKIKLDDAYLDAAILGEAITARVEGGTLTLNGFMFYDTAFEMAPADGGLAFAAGDAEGAQYAGATARLLEDGAMDLTLTAGDGETLTMIMTR